MQVAGLAFAGLTGALNPKDVTPLTFYRYWYWYRSQPLWQPYVYGSGTLGLLALLMPVAVVLAPGRRPRLHGDARWARRASSSASSAGASSCSTATSAARTSSSQPRQARARRKA
jgi:hypothetical protein